jgi:Zn-dependent peptidase ImmA (M78 family)/DNA-binding XRE family transcriptional regulator
MVTRRDEQVKLGQRLKQAREAAGYTQEEVAKLLGLSRPTVADIEGGRRRVDSLLLRDLAALFGVKPWELLGPPDETSKTARLRKLLFAELESTGASASDKKQIARFWQILEHFAWLSKEMGREKPVLTAFAAGRAYPENGRRFKSRVPDFLIEAEALQARELLGLGDSLPPGDLRYLIESRGVPVFLWPLDRDLISGLFLNHPELGPVLLVNAAQVRWRRVFTLAHEFAHVWLHRHEHALVGRIFSPQGDPRMVERQANAFAAELLMPEEGVKRLLGALNVEGPLTAEDVVRLQRAFGVSYKAMLVRLKNLRMVTQEHFEKLGQESPVRLALQLGYEVDQSEVGEVREPRFYERLPMEYVVLVLQAWEEGIIGEGKAVQMLDTDHYSLNEFIRLLEEVKRRQQEEDVPLGIGG